ncbi:MAG: T9SS type A sorting domain-containing protein [Ignavibacteria bacterium]|nr:T9SS type A sorting domain-containing protein [Ignavibacteria bacterium]
MNKPLLFLSLLLFIPGLIFPQSDDPNKDQLPAHLRGMVPPMVPMSVVVNDEGYENFYLGIDFAEPHLSVNILNPVQFFNAFNTNATHYTMNGIDWFSNNPPLSVPRGDPVTAYDSLGNLYYMNMTGQSTIVGCYVVKSTNNGQNWSAPVFAINGNDKNWIACDQTGGPYANYVYCTMTLGSGYGSFSRSTDHGVSFQTTFSPNTQSAPGMMVAVGPNGSVPGGCVYVVTNSGSYISHVYSFYRSTDGGVNFQLMSQQGFAGYVGTIQSGRNTVEYMRTRPYPFIAADNSYGAYRGRLYLVYAKNTPNQNGAKPDIFCRYSTDQGMNWTSEVLINNDANTTANHQWFPSIWCDNITGRLFVKWFDSRNCPTSDSAEVYASYSDDGGVTFVPNQKIGTSKFKIYCSSCGGGGYPATYQGDYDAVASYGKNSMLCWSDFRNGAFGSYTAYFPDYAMKTNTDMAQFVNGDSATVTVTIPSVKLYNDYVKFTAVLDTNPAAGTLQISFVNGKDSIYSYPDSVRIRVKAVGSVTPKRYKLLITGRGPNGFPAHRREVNLLVNTSMLDIATNRSGIVQYSVNGQTYNIAQRLYFANGTSVTVSAPYYYGTGGTRYRFVNWSNNGDTTHTFTLNSNLNLLATYAAQYKIVLNSVIPNTFGGNTYYDSAASFTFGVLSRHYQSGNTHYNFRGWTGAGNGAYTSPDSSGTDSAVTWSMHNPIVETCRWLITVGINNISSEIPEEFKLYDNYPNPFNPETNIKFDIAEKGLANMTVYDMLGREVAVLVNQEMTPGKYEFRWDASNLESGVYFFRLTTSKYTMTKRMVLLK